MRLHRVLLPLLVLAGFSVAQDTNFSVGPQYLVTIGNPMLLRPIATPSMSLSGETLAGTSAVPTPTEPPAFAPLETVVYLDNVYWGEHKPDEVVARRVEPPSMSPDQTAWYMNFVASQLTPPAPGGNHRIRGRIQRHRTYWCSNARQLTRKHIGCGRDRKYRCFSSSGTRIRNISWRCCCVLEIPQAKLPPVFLLIRMSFV